MDYDLISDGRHIWGVRAVFSEPFEWSYIQQISFLWWAGKIWRVGRSKKGTSLHFTSLHRSDLLECEWNSPLSVFRTLCLTMALNLGFRITKSSPHSPFTLTSQTDESTRGVKRWILQPDLSVLRVKVKTTVVKELISNIQKNLISDFKMCFLWVAPLS